MGLFKKKRSEVVDLTRAYPRKRVDTKNETPMASNSEPASPFGNFFNAGSNTPESSSETSGYVDYSSGDSTMDVDEKRRRLAKRLSDMTEKIEDLSNQIYHLQQRIEVLEKKGGVGTSGETPYGVF